MTANQIITKYHMQRMRTRRKNTWPISVKCEKARETKSQLVLISTHLIERKKRVARDFWTNYRVKSMQTYTRVVPDDFRHWFENCLSILLFALTGWQRKGTISNTSSCNVGFWSNPSSARQVSAFKALHTTNSSVSLKPCRKKKQNKTN